MAADKSQLVTRASKDTPLTHAEMDANINQIGAVIDDAKAISDSISTTSEANKVPRANGAGKISATWLPDDIANAPTSKEPAINPGTTAQYYRGDKNWRDFATDVRAAVLTGLVATTNAAVAAADTVLVAIGKLQAQINSLIAGTTSLTQARAIRYLDPIVVANATGATAMNLSTAATFEYTLTGNTTLSFSNVPTLDPNTVMTVVVTVKQGATPYTLVLPGSTPITLGGVAIPTPGANKQQDYIFTTKNGSSWEVRAGANT